MRKILVMCLNCERHEVVDSFYLDGSRCKCGGGYKCLKETNLPLTITNNKRSVTNKPSRPVKPKPVSEKRCDHDYRLLADSIDMIEYRADEVKNIRVEGMALFHCAKCLDIQKKVVT